MMKSLTVLDVGLGGKQGLIQGGDKLEGSIQQKEASPHREVNHKYSKVNGSATGEICLPLSTNQWLVQDG